MFIAFIKLWRLCSQAPQNQAPSIPNITYITLNIIEYLANELAFYYTLLLINITFYYFYGKSCWQKLSF